MSGFSAVLAKVMFLLVTRQSADVYIAYGEDKLIYTRGCTISARLMDAAIDNSRNKPYLVFFDSDGNEEGRCEVVKDKPARPPPRTPAPILRDKPATIHK